MSWVSTSMLPGWMVVSVAVVLLVVRVTFLGGIPNQCPTRLSHWWLGGAVTSGDSVLVVDSP